jgi:hypothetical protein
MCQLNVGNRTLERKIGLFHKSYLLPRKDGEVMINDYNPALLLAAKGNIDVQFVATLDPSLRDYVTGYVAKHESKSATDELERTCLFSTR